LKTTLNLDDQLLRLAKKSAAERGVTLTQVVEEALSAAVLRPPRVDRFQLRWTPIAGRRLPDVDVADRSALYDRMENRP
jgi:hypothetical protein